MSIRVREVTKIYGSQRALSKVSFEVKEGEIVGFLGPNGAGKSTMMKIITCYIPQTYGVVEVCGHDVSSDSIAVRKLVGYLPEHNPLYLEMYVKEYLEFVAGLYRLKNKKQRVEEMIKTVGLELEQHKKIGALSKGYRQRVGIAQALIHDPKVIIMDEPTSGLDPNQLTEIRNLIREIGKTKTIMLSTHIMQEVKAICDRVIIINRGELVANKPVGEITAQEGGRKTYVVEFDGEVTKKALMGIPGVQEAVNIKEKLWEVSSSSDIDLRNELFKFAVNNQLVVLTLQQKEQDLEDIFKSLTSK
jgi:ABC-2 type transport system ATP-binding protein